MFGTIIEQEMKRVREANIRLSKEEVADLVERSKNGDQKAMEDLWTAHLLFLSKNLSKSKYVGYWIEPDEALSMSWESLLKVIHTWNGSSSFSHWFYKKLLIDLETEWRRRKRNHDICPRLSELYPNDPMDGLGADWSWVEWPD